MNEMSAAVPKLIHKYYSAELSDYSGGHKTTYSDILYSKKAITSQPQKSHLALCPVFNLFIACKHPPLNSGQAQAGGHKTSQKRK